MENAVKTEAKAQHTPGPWVEVSIDGWDGVRPANNALPICRLVENNPANARLIAAAPEMLKQTELFARSIEYQIKKNLATGDTEGARLKQFTLDACRAVIAKAKGA
jgi:hypothetical protein